MTVPKSMTKINRVVYRAWHSLSSHGLLGYIGCARFGLERRILEHVRAAKKSATPIYVALRKYGTECWTWEVLESGFASDAAMKRAEIRLIALWGTFGAGYNATPGGDGQSPMLGRSHTAAARAKLSAAAKGKRPSAATRRKIGLVFKGKKLSQAHRLKIGRTRVARGIPSPMQGKHHSAATIRKMQRSQRGSKNHQYGKPTWIAGRHHTEATRAKMRAAWVRRKELHGY